MKSAHLFHLLIGITLIIFSCSKTTIREHPQPVNQGPDEVCPEATLCLRNPTDDKVVFYSWGSNRIEDTLYPGECATQTVYDQVGDGGVVTFYFYNGSSTTLYDLYDCYVEYELTSGFVDLKEDCNNGEFDPQSGENDTDCGGFCPPCDAFVFPCQLQSEYINFEGTFNSSAVDVGYVDSWGLDELRLYFSLTNFGTLRMNLNISKMPDESRKFVIGSYDHQATMTYQGGISAQGSAKAGEEIYLTKIDSVNWEINFCGVIFDFGGLEVETDANMKLNTKK